MVKQERAARTRQALIRAGAEVFAQEGFVSASLSAISRRAGVSSGALHFHFESKKALAEAVESEALEAVRRIVREASARDDRALAGLIDATHGLMNRIAEDVVVRAGFELSGDPGRGEGPTLRWEWQQWVEGMVRRSAEEGWLAQGVSADDAAAAIVAATMGFEVMGTEDKAWLSEKKVAGFWELLLPRLTERHAQMSAGWSTRGRVGAQRGEPDPVVGGQSRPGTL
ncbi:ScbR family autoregulator-binding transcription factor [Streptomyces sp. NPDC093586]|uniref:ScbR family autoregulator-binding transcription factor n=1 Tax=Streptomyces sp. NPDC093586 TaxID=3366042 RepID=UPI00380F7712